MINSAQYPSANYSGGFARRLNSVLDALGLPNPGRYLFIKNITGMGHSNSRSLFVDDRPPKKQIFLDNLCTSLASELTNKVDSPISQVDMYNFLICGNGIVAKFINTGVSDLESALLTIPVSFQSRLAVVVNEIGRENKVDIFSQLDNQQLDILLKKMSVYAHKNNANTDSDDFKVIVSSAIRLAEHSLL
jgi:hypothetical protein